MRKYIHILFFLLLLGTMHSYMYAQERAVAVVYDNSGSMRKAGQCEGINYAFQIMVGLLHPKDELFVFKMEPPQVKVIDLNNKKGSILNIEQTYDCRANNTPFTAINEAKNQLSNSRKKFKYLIILSDGEIDPGSIPQDNDLLRNFVENTGTRVIFLNVNTKDSRLDKYLAHTHATQQTLRTRGNFEQIVETMEKIAASVMTVADGGVSVTTQANQVKFTAPLPLKRIIVLEQDTRSNAQLPTLTNAKAANQSLFIGEGYKAQKSSSFYRMTGLITHIQMDASEKKTIPKGDISLNFSSNVDINKLKVLPEAAAKLLVEVRGKDLVPRGSIYTVCDTLAGVTLVAKIVDLNGKPLDSNVLQDSEVTFVDEESKRTTQLTYDEKTKEFTTTVRLVGERLPISVKAKYKGYFNYQSNIYTIVKKHCPIPKAIITADKKKLTANVLDLDNAESVIVKPQIVVDDNPPREPTAEEMQYLSIEQVNKKDTRLRIKVTQENGQMIIQPAPFICACFTKAGDDQLKLKLTSTNAKLKVKSPEPLTIQVHIEDASFWDKCGWLVISTILSILGLIYIWGVYKKPRFARGSEIVVAKENKLIKRRAKSYPLPTGFFNRYLVPFTEEKRTVDSVTFKAGSRDSHVLISSGTQSEDMYISGFPVENPGKKDLRLSNGEHLEIAKRNRKEIYEYKKL